MYDIYNNKNCKGKISLQTVKGGFSLNEIEEVSKAIQETAKFGTKGLEVAERAGGFFAKVFLLPANEISGIITDKLRFIRWSRLIDMADEVENILRDRGITNTRPVTPKIALPIFEKASLEDDRILHELWNNLLVNAMNPEFNSEIRYGFIEIINNITAQEALLLEIFYNTLLKDNHHRPLEKIIEYTMTKEKIILTTGISEEEYAVNINNLMRVQLIAPAILIDNSFTVSNEPITIYKGSKEVTLTPLGVLFVEACMKV